MLHATLLLLCLCLSQTLHATFPARFPAEPVVVPFLLVGNSIFVEATVNGRTGNFLLDTGSPKLMLNSAWFSGSANAIANEYLVDLNGKVIKPKYLEVKSLEVQGLPMRCPTGYVLDLENIEEAKGIPVFGILGYAVFEHLELLFDFENQELVIFPLEKNGLPDCESYLYCPVDSLDLKMSGHIPYVQAKLGGKSLRLGIDSGSEVNLLQPRAMKKAAEIFQTARKHNLQGLSDESKKRTVGWLREIKLGHLESQPLEVTLADLDHLNDYLPVDLDGILGSCFLMQGKMAINYRREKLYLWETTTGETLARGGKK